MLFSDTEFHWDTTPFAYEVERHRETLLINSLRTEFELNRRSPLVQTAWLLGFYQAEGLKTPGPKGVGGWFVVANKSRVVLRMVIDAIIAIGIHPSRLTLNLKWQRTPEADVLAYYAPLALAHTIRQATDSKAGDFNALLVIQRSCGFADLLRTVLMQLDPLKLPPEAKLAYLLGFLVGDGSVTLMRSGAMLRAHCGDLREAQILDGLLKERFGSTRQMAPMGRGFEVGRGINQFHGVDLLEMGAFVGTSARIRLFHLAHRLDQLSTMGANRRWGNLDANMQPTSKVISARERLAKFDDEWAFIKQTWPTEREAIMRRKGVLYEYSSWS